MRALLVCAGPEAQQYQHGKNIARRNAACTAVSEEALRHESVLQGLPTAQQLAAQLPGAMRQVRQGAYLPPQGAGLASIGVAKLASLLKVPRCHLPAVAPA